MKEQLKLSEQKLKRIYSEQAIWDRGTATTKQPLVKILDEDISLTNPMKQKATQDKKLLPNYGE
jgi:hypothetical protein